MKPKMKAKMETEIETELKSRLREVSDDLLIKPCEKVIRSEKLVTEYLKENVKELIMCKRVNTWYLIHDSCDDNDAWKELKRLVKVIPNVVVEDVGEHWEKITKGEKLIGSDLACGLYQEYILGHYYGRENTNEIGNYLLYLKHWLKEATKKKDIMRHQKELKNLERLGFSNMNDEVIVRSSVRKDWEKLDKCNKCKELTSFYLDLKLYKLYLCAQVDVVFYEEGFIDFNR